MTTLKIKNITFIHGDCMEFLKDCKENQFDLAIVDPPYGIGEGNKKNLTRTTYTGFNGQKKKRLIKPIDYGGNEFDFSIPDKEYFDNIFLNSKNQIIWGGNYMTEHLPGSMGWVVWNKLNGDCDQSDCELAFTSFKRGCRKFDFKWHGMLQHDMKNKETRIHPTQKPVKLYEWLLMNYAKQGQTILDTHGGSGSIAIACHNLGYELTIIEKDKEYFDNMVKRFKQQTAQQRLFKGI